MSPFAWLVVGTVSLLTAVSAGMAASFFSNSFLDFNFEEVEDVPDQAGDDQRAIPNGRTSGSRAVEAMKAYVQAPYTWAGATSKEKGLDCSGLPYRGFRDIGITIPRVSRNQAKACRMISEEAAKQTPGAMFFFVGAGKPLAWENVFHVGVSVGDGEHVIESQCWEGKRCRSGEPCKKGVDLYKWGWWEKRYEGRVFYGILPHLVEYDNL